MGEHNYTAEGTGAREPFEERGAEIPAANTAPYRTRNTRPRKHMGVATNDPDYLPPVTAPEALSDKRRPSPDNMPGYRMPASQHKGAVRPHGVAAPTGAGGAAGAGSRHQPGQLHYDRYLSTPKKGRAIFTARQDRQRHRFMIVLAVIAIAAVALAVWFFLLR